VSDCDQVKINNLDTCCEQAEDVKTAKQNKTSVSPVIIIPPMLHYFEKRKTNQQQQQQQQQRLHHRVAQ
jgi:hypothetical protein